MLYAPFVLPFTLLAVIVTIGLWSGGLYLVWAWWAGVLVGTAYLVAGLGLLAMSLLGRPLVLLFRRPGNDEPSFERSGASLEIEQPDGSRIWVEQYGPEEAPPLVLIHGWGMHGAAWYYTKRTLARRFRLVIWDLPGLGQSRRPHHHDYRPEKFAADLDAVLTQVVRRPAIVLGYSIGGMIALSYCQRFGPQATERLAGLILVNTSYTNPTRTTTASGFFSAIQRPVLEPILHLIAWLFPLFWAVNWLSYLNGTAHLGGTLTGFAGSDTRGQLDFATRFYALASPAVLARGVLGMFRYDAQAVLPHLEVPVLVIGGHLDRLTTPEANRELAAAIPSARYVELSPAGHVSVIERHAELNETLIEFVQTCADRAAA